MKREHTNIIRFILDECLPPIVRDSKYFMWIFYVISYRTFKVSRYMNFKARAYNMSELEYSNYYENLGLSISRSRITDLNEESIEYVLNKLKGFKDFKVLDVGCGNGFLLNKIINEYSNLESICGVDIVEPKIKDSRITYHTGMLPRLAFDDNAFDIVTCCHVLEHLIDLRDSLDEIFRIAKKRVILVIPCQRYYKYTLDEHLNFFPSIEPLLYLFNGHSIQVEKRSGDWCLSVDLIKVNKLEI